MLNHFLVLAESDPVAHVVNHPWLKSADGYWLWSSNQGTLVLSAIIVIFGMLWVSKKIATGPSSQGARAYVTNNSFAHMIEVMCLYLRDEVCRPLLKDRTNKLMPFLWTVFFFILVNNLLGLIPIMDVLHLLVPAWREGHMTPVGGTATQNIWVTGVLAAIAAVVFNVAAIARLGVGGYFGHMTGGAPWFVAWMIFILEFLGQIVIKPVALAIRLFANMTAGHVLLAVIIGFTLKGFGSLGLVGGVPIAGVSILAGTAIMFLELFVAFLQAFIFMFLTTLFIAQMSHDHHDDHAEAEAHDADHPMIDDAAVPVSAV